MTWGNQYAMSHTVIERFLRFVEIDADACWRWRGYVMRTPHGNGYGKFNNLLAHRVAYELFIGDIGERCHVHHRCGVTDCVNPDHLEMLTPAEHGKLSAKAQQTHCRRGHEFTEENTARKPNGTRQCRICWRAKQREYRQRRRAR